MLMLIRQKSMYTDSGVVLLTESSMVLDFKFKTTTEPTDLSNKITVVSLVHYTLSYISPLFGLPKESSLLYLIPDFLYKDVLFFSAVISGSCYITY